MGSHNKAAHSYDPVICQVCQKEYKNIFLFRCHLRRSHNIVDPNHVVALIRDVKPEFDGFKRKQSNAVHKCDECDKSFKRFTNLKYHIKAAHVHEPCPCPFCDDTVLKNQTYLAQHMKRFHKDLNCSNGDKEKQEKSNNNQSSLIEEPCSRESESPSLKNGEYLSLNSTNDLSNENNSDDSSNLTQYQKKRKELVKKWREMEEEQKERIKAEVKASKQNEMKQQESCGQNYNPDELVEVKLEAADVSDDESSEGKQSLEGLEESESGSEAHTCGECGKIFFELRKLKSHINTAHTYESCPCPFCEGKILKNQTYLSQHIKRFHKDCKVPKEKDEDFNQNAIKNEDINNLHYDMEDRSHLSSISSDTKKEENEILKQLDYSEDGGSDQHDCKECGKSFSHAKSLKSHVNTAHTFEPCPCPFCEGKILKNQTYLSQHLKRFHKNCKVPNDEAGDFIKDENDKFYEIKEKEDTDEDINNSVYDKEDIPDLFNTSLDMKKEEKEILSSLDYSESGGSEHYDCNECGKSFLQAKSLRSHVNTAHTFEPCHCPFCEGKIMKNQTYLAQHLKRFHKHQILPEESFSRIGDDKFDTKKDEDDESKSAYTSDLCPFCGNSFKYLAQHIKRAHSNAEESIDMSEGNNNRELQDSDFLCHLCGDVFETNQCRRSHIKTEHSDQRQQCPYCPNLYKNLPGHIRDVHDKLECVCPQCGKTCSTKKALRGHIVTVHPEEGQSRICPVCAKKFKSSHNLRQHLRRSIECCPTDEADCVSCPQCGKKFANKAHLYSHHIHIHVIENVNCPTCGRTYKNKIALRKHIKHNHDGVAKKARLKGSEDIKTRVDLPSTEEIIELVAPSNGVIVK